MSSSDLIVVRRQGKTIPTEYLKLVLPLYNTAYGCSIPQNGIVATGSGDSGADLESIQNTCEDFDTTITFYFVKTDVAVNMDDVSPHWLVENDKNQPQALAFVSGEFPGFKKAGSSHPSSYHFVEDYLRPKVKDLFEMTDDLKKVMNFINKKSFKDELLSQASKPAVITFVLADGESTTIALSDTAKEYDWGWVSNHHVLGFEVEASKETAAPAERKTMISMPKRSTTREKHVPTEQVGPVNPTQGTSTSSNKQSSNQPASVSSVPQTKVTQSSGTATAVITNYTVRRYKPNVTKSRKQRRSEYQKYYGYAPRGWESGVEIDVYCDAKGNMIPWSEVKKLGLQAVGLPARQQLEREIPKDTEPQHIPEKSEIREVTTEVLPIMSPPTKDFFKTFLAREDVKKMIAESGKEISDPSDIQKLEAKIQDFGSQLGVKGALFDIMKLDYPMILEIAEKNAKGLALFSWNLINLYRAKDTKLSATETHVLAKEELKPSVQMPKRRANG